MLCGSWQSRPHRRPRRLRLRGEEVRRRKRERKLDLIILKVWGKRDFPEQIKACAEMCDTLVFSGLQTCPPRHPLSFLDGDERRIKFRRIKLSHPAQSRRRGVYRRASRSVAYRKPRYKRPAGADGRNICMHIVRAPRCHSNFKCLARLRPS